MGQADKKAISEESFWAATAKVGEEHAKRVVEIAQKLLERVKGSKILARLIDDVTTLVGMVRDYVRGDYREVSWKSVAAAVVALLYVADPVDFVPDFIPIVGQLDDEATLLLAIYLIGEDMGKYRAWRDGQIPVAVTP